MSNVELMIEDLLCTEEDWELNGPSDEELRRLQRKHKKMGAVEAHKLERVSTDASFFLDSSGPTRALPGTQLKLELLVERAKRKLPLFQNADLVPDSSEWRPAFDDESVDEEDEEEQFEEDDDLAAQVTEKVLKHESRQLEENRQRRLNEDAAFELSRSARFPQAQQDSDSPQEQERERVLLQTQRLRELGLIK